MKKGTSNTKYALVINELTRRINNGEFSATGRIPSENELSRAYNVSVITVRRALADLVYAGTIIRIKGKGSFVSSREDGSEVLAQVAPGQGIVPLVLLSYEENDSSLVSIVSGAQTTLSRNGYSMTLECSNLNLATERGILSNCIRDKAAGVLLFSVDPESNAGHLMDLQNAGVPFVLLDRTLRSFPVTSVASYHFDGMYQIIQRLLALGHRNILYISNEVHTSVHMERLKGYQMALRAGGIPFREELCLFPGDSWLHNLETLIQKYSATAVACINDKTGVAVMEYLKDRNYLIPDDISVTGFDDSNLGKYAGLTSVRQQFREIGRIGAEKLLGMIRRESGHSCAQIQVEVVMRGSTGPLKEVKVNEHDFA